MARLRHFAFIALLCFPLLAAPIAAETPIVPGSLALVYADVSPKKADPAAIAEARGSWMLSEMAAQFASSGGFEAIPKERVDRAQKELYFFGSIDTTSIADAILLGKKLGAEAVAVASIAAIDDILALTLRLYETKGSRLIVEDLGSGPSSDLGDRLGSGIGRLCAAWASRTSLGSSAPSAVATAAAAETKPLPQLRLSLLAGYETLVVMNWEIEASAEGYPFSLGAEFAYRLLDPAYGYGEGISAGLVGRWWPQGTRPLEGLMLALDANIGIGFGWAWRVAPAIGFAVGWGFLLDEGKGAVRLAHALRVQPELGISWSTSQSFSGVMPYAGLRLGL